MKHEKRTTALLVVAGSFLLGFVILNGEGPAAILRLVCGILCFTALFFALGDEEFRKTDWLRYVRIACPAAAVYLLIRLILLLT